MQREQPVQMPQGWGVPNLMKSKGASVDAVELERKRGRDEARGVRKGQFSEGFIGHGEDFDF